MPKFIAYAIDLSGVAMARYDLAATEKESAAREAPPRGLTNRRIRFWASPSARSLQTAGRHNVQV